MTTIIDRLIQAGHFAQVCEAGQYAAVKSDTLNGLSRVTDVRWEPESDHPTNELFAAIDGLDNADELDAVADYIAEQFADDYEVAA